MSAVAIRSRARRKPRADLEPFSLAHFRAWALELVLDNGLPWVLEPFQAGFIEDVFSGVPEAWLIMPEGNAKTTICAGLALYKCQFKRSAYVPVAAASRDQAEITYRQAEGFVFRSKAIKAKFTCLRGYRRIRCDEMGSEIQIFAADDRTGDGVIPDLAIAEELGRQRDMRLYRTWRGKLEKKGGQIVAISTAGEPGAEFETTRERIRKEGRITRNGSFLRSVSKNLILHEWAVPEKGDVEDLEMVKSANPLKAITVAVLRRKLESPTMTMQHWRRFVCNLPTRSDSSAIQEAEWHGAISTVGIPEGQPIWLGLDVAWKYDTTALVPLWIRDENFRLFGPAEVLIPPRDGTSLDPDLVEAALVAIHHRNPIHTVVMNVQIAGQIFANWVISEIGAVVVDRGQTPIPAAEDYERFMEGLRNGKLKHSGDQGLTAHALHAIARVDPVSGKARFERPSQTRDSIEQEHRVIDALTAAARVHAQAMVPVETEAEFHMAVR